MQWPIVDKYKNVLMVEIIFITLLTLSLQRKRYIMHQTFIFLYNSISEIINCFFFQYLLQFLDFVKEKDFIYII